MFESLAKAILETVFSQGGWLGVLACLSIIALVVIWVKSNRDRHAHEKELRTQFEVRLKEFRVILEALDRSSQALSHMKASSDDWSEAAVKLVNNFSGLIRDVADIQRRIEDIQRRLPM